jgi:hypothetical protein
MRVETMLKKEKEGSLFKDTKIAHVMYSCLDEFLKIAAGGPIGQLVNEGNSYLTGVELPPGTKKPKGQFPSNPTSLPIHDPPAPPEDTEPPQVFDGMSKIQSILGGGVEQDPVTYTEAARALKRLDKLERNKLTREELQRGALTGAMVGPAALAAGTLVGGGAEGAISGALKKPSVGKGLKSLGLSALKGKRKLLGAAASGAVFGAGLPTVRRKLEEASEKEKLREYLGVSKGGRLRRRITKELGV